MKRLFMLLAIAASTVLLSFCAPAPAPTAILPPTAVPTSTSACTPSLDCISSGTPVVRLNGTPFAGQDVSLTVNTQVVTDASGTAKITFVAQGTCTLNSLDLQMMTQITTRPNPATIFSQDQGTSICVFQSAPNKKPVVAGKIVTIQFPDDPAIKIIVIPGIQVKVAVYAGRVLVGVDQTQREVGTNPDGTKQEAQVDLRTRTLSIQQAGFSKVETDAFSRLGVPTTSIPPTITPVRVTPTAQITFWADADNLSTGQCTNIHWRTENVSEVYYQSQPVIGNGDRRECLNSPGAHTFTLTVIKRDGTRETYPLTIMATDTVGPSITQITEIPVAPTPIYLNSGCGATSKTIRANVRDPSGVSEVQLYYRLDTTSSWTSLPMPKIGSDTYQVTIDASKVAKGEGTIEYYIQAWDNNKNSTVTEIRTISVYNCVH